LIQPQTAWSDPPPVPSFATIYSRQNADSGLLFSKQNGDRRELAKKSIRSSECLSGIWVMKAYGTSLSKL